MATVTLLYFTVATYQYLTKIQSRLPSMLTGSESWVMITGYFYQKFFLKMMFNYFNYRFPRIFYFIFYLLTYLFLAKGGGHGTMPPPPVCAPVTRKFSKLSLVLFWVR